MEDIYAAYAASLNELGIVDEIVIKAAFEKFLSTIPFDASKYAEFQEELLLRFPNAIRKFEHKTHSRFVIWIYPMDMESYEKPHAAFSQEPRGYPKHQGCVVRLLNFVQTIF